MDRLRAESSVLQFQAFGTPAQQYKVQFLGKSLARERGKVAVRERHEFEIRLGASYPRTMPEIRWLTPIYHPNISEIGMVCLGGYGTHWVPSLNLDELCIMLWDMARFHNYDIRSPYNREAALWAANQSTFLFPLDPPPAPRPSRRAGEDRAGSEADARPRRRTIGRPPRGRIANAAGRRPRASRRGSVSWTSRSTCAPPGPIGYARAATRSSSSTEPR